MRAGFFCAEIDSRRNHEIDRLGPFALLVRFDLECDALSFGQILQSGSLPRRDVHEHCATPAAGLEEAVAAFAVEELDRSSHGHREASPALPCRYASLAHRRTGLSMRTHCAH